MVLKLNWIFLGKAIFKTRTAYNQYVQYSLTATIYKCELKNSCKTP